MTSSPLIFLCPSSLLLYIVGPLSFPAVTIFIPRFTSAHHLLLSPSFPFCPLLPPLALPDVTWGLLGLMLKSNYVHAVYVCMHALLFRVVICIFVCVWHIYKCVCGCDVLIHPIAQSRTPDSHHPWEPSGRCLTPPHPNTSWHPINLKPPCIHTYECVRVRVRET